MKIWSQIVRNDFQSGQLRRPDVPLAFMHIPKSGGTSLMHALDRTVADGPHVRGLDRFTFGGFDEFSTIPPLMRRAIHLTSQTLRPEAATIFGHFALSTLEQHYPNADIITVLREPTSRILSHWTYWRGLSWRQLRFWGPAWSARLKLATQPLAAFLSAPEIACQTDNIVARMLLWPHKLIPDHGFIDPANDAAILTIARHKLNRFGFIGIAENGTQLTADLVKWYGQPLTQLRLNETAKIPRRRQTRLNRELCSHTMQILHQRSRLDIDLWRDIASRDGQPADTLLLQETARMQMVARCSLLLG